jgi:cadmium resistance protein CadD (predicted permease)
MIRLIAVAVAAYISTNIDDLLLLCAFCAHPAYSTTQIVAGQFIGIGILVVASLILALTSVVIPLPYVGLLGVAPIYLGCSRVLTRSKFVQRPTSSSRQTLVVITATIANGATTSRHTFRSLRAAMGLSVLLLSPCLRH